MTETLKQQAKNWAWTDIGQRHTHAASMDGGNRYVSSVSPVRSGLLLGRCLLGAGGGPKPLPAAFAGPSRLGGPDPRSGRVIQGRGRVWTCTVSSRRALQDAAAFVLMQSLRAPSGRVCQREYASEILPGFGGAALSP